MRDLFPTLADLAGVPVDTKKVGYEHLGGSSLAPVFDDGSATVKDVAISQFPRCWQNNTGFDGNDLNGPGDEKNKTVSWESMSDCHWVRNYQLDYMGYSMRVEGWRYVEWVKWDGEHLKPLWDQVVARELYDHSKENPLTVAYMDETENVNLADEPKHSADVAKLSDRLHEEVAKWMVPIKPVSSNMVEGERVVELV